MTALYVITAWAFLASLAWLFVHAATRGDTPDDFAPSPDVSPASHEVPCDR